MISILFTLAINAAWAGLEAVQSNSSAMPVAAPASDLPSVDVIDKCLTDKLQAKLDAQKAAEEAANNQPPGQSPPPTYPFHLVDPSQMPAQCGGDLDKFKQSLSNVQAFCASPASAKKAINGSMQLGCRTYTRDEYCTQVNTRMTALANAEGATMASVMAAAKSEFDWYANGKAPVEGQQQPKNPFQYTGYYGAEIDGRRPPCTDKFPYPVYSTPFDLRDFTSTDPQLSDSGVKGRPDSCGKQPVTGDAITVCRKTDDGKYVPYYTREEISKHVLNGKGAEIGCAANPIDIAFLQIQGDGQMYIKNDNGQTEEVWRLNTGGKNGRSGYLLGNVIRCAGGEISSMTTIRAYLDAHPREMMMLLNRNPSYLFFDKVKGGDPKGVDGITLVEGHSLATDRRFLRTGAQTLFDVPGAGGKHDCALANAVDSGSAINNMHADIYKGEGAEAFKKADALNSQGALFVAVPKNAGKAVANCK
jgi:membrane-bound lytic murein transglycosylase